MLVETVPCRDRTKTEDCLAQLEVVLQSETFRKSPSVCLLLRYLVTKAVAGNTEDLRETTIATEVFHRRDFDARVDNIVRVQTHRLRKILKAYYEGEGKDAVLQFVLPRGSYVPQIHDLATEPGTGEAVEEPVASIDPPPADEPSRVGSPYIARRLLLLLAASFGLGMAALWALLTFAGIDLRRPPAAAAAEDLLSGPPSRLWSGIIDPGIPTVVAFTNPVFLRGASGDVLFVYRGHISAPFRARIDVPLSEIEVHKDLVEREKPLYFIDTWTGTGEALAIRKLTNQFAALRLPLEVKRSRILSYDDIRSSNVIFVGSPWGNKILESVSARERPFSCCADMTPSVIVNHHPRPGEPSHFTLDRNAETGEMTTSYGIFTVMPGLQAGRKIVISSGLTTHASWAGIDYLTSAAGVEDLGRKLGVKDGQPLHPYFDAVIRTEIINGEASKTTIVALRPGSDKTR